MVDMVASGDITAAAAAAIFGKPLITNVYRSVIVEAIVAAALPDWEWCSADYASCDFRSSDGVRVEVKQSALRQSWGPKLARPGWDIAARTGYWTEGINWVAMPGRNADVYALALHAVTDETADHRDPAQWCFYVVAATDLPAQKTIGQTSLERLAVPVSFGGLSREVAAVADRCRANFAAASCSLSAG